MIKNAVCTISTISHIFKAYALADSLQEFGFRLNILLVDCEDVSNINPPIDVKLYNLEHLGSEQGKKLISKYKGNLDKLRWGLKAVFLECLLKENNQVIYVDNDIHFFQSPEVYFKELETQSLLLTPHFYPSAADIHQNWLEANFKVGLYNAGFIAVNINGIEALHWWANCCLYNIKKSYWRGLFDDQKYLDLLPILFEKVKLIKQRGANLAGWNYKVLQPKNSEVTFIHFAELTMREFSHLQNEYYVFYQEYLLILKKYNKKYQFKPTYISNYSIVNYIYFLAWKLNRLFEKPTSLNDFK